MIINDGYSFNVSLSIEAFRSKRESACMIASSKDAAIREERMNYGYYRGVSFYEVTVTPKQLLDQLLEGRVMCSLFTPKRYRNDGSFGMSEKCNDNFVGSFVIGVDIDDTSYNNAKEYVANLSLKPTFYYTSYSNMQLDPETLKCKGARFRLIYVFDQKIEDVYYFRYLAKNLNSIIEKDVKEPITDECNLRASQYYNGTCKYNSSVILDYDYTGNIYSFEDIGASEEDYIYFLKSKSNYKALTAQQKQEINVRLGELGEKPIESKFEPIECNEIESLISPKLIEDMKSQSYDDFMRYNRWKYKYIYRSEKGEWIDDSYKLVDEDYFSLYFNVNKVKDGQKRRKKLFERMCLRRVLDPNIKADELLFNAYEDRARFFEIDKDLDIDCLVRNVNIAMQMEIEDIKEMYSENIKWLKERSGRSGIILKQGNYTSQSDIKAVRIKIIRETIDLNRSFKENLEAVQKKIKINEWALYRYYKENGLKPDNRKLSDEEVIDLIDISISANMNLKNIRSNGYKIDKSRFLKLYKIAKE